MVEAKCHVVYSQPLYKVLYSKFKLKCLCRKDKSSTAPYEGVY